MSKLNPNAQKWVDALRSGKYKQGSDALVKGNEYCCLGVACAVAIKNGLTVKVEDSGEMFDGEWAYLPKSVQQWLHIKDSHGTFNGNSLANLNDLGADFAAIAQCIEEHAEELGVSK